jgi:hypothetical protein
MKKDADDTTHARQGLIVVFLEEFLPFAEALDINKQRYKLLHGGIHLPLQRMMVSGSLSFLGTSHPSP